MDNKLYEEFYKRLRDYCDINACWEWRGRINQYGYGILGFNNKKYMAHRISYIIHVGEIKEGLYICHKCDNRKCVNPSHLFMGTAKDNTRDRLKKARAIRMPRKNEIGKRIFNRRIELQLSQEEFGKLIGVCGRMISDLETNRIKLHFTTIKRIEKTFNIILIDELPHDNSIGTMLKNYRIKNRISPAQLAKEINVHRCTIEKWENGERDGSHGNSSIKLKQFLETFK